MEKAKKIQELITPLLEEMEIELVEVSFRSTRGNRVLRIFVDTETGITIKQCKQVSRAVSEILDAEDIIPYGYRLEVSSPGLDRPLKSEKDFKRNSGRQVKIEYTVDGEKRLIKGLIGSVTADGVVIKTAQQEELIPFQFIKNAKIVPKW